MKINPKSHNSLFKWLIASFTEEFFAHYFPEVGIGKYRFIDKRPPAKLKISAGVLL